MAAMRPVVSWVTWGCYRGYVGILQVLQLRLGLNSETSGPNQCADVEFDSLPHHKNPELLVEIVAGGLGRNRYGGEVIVVVLPLCCPANCQSY